MDRKKKRILLISLVLLAAIVAAGIWSHGRHRESEQSGTEGTVTTDLLNPVKALKNEVIALLKDIKSGNTENARERATALSNTVKTVRPPIDAAAAVFKDSVPHLLDAQALLYVADEGMTELLLPALDLMEAYPLSDLKVGEGFNTGLIGKYLDFAEAVLPKAEELLNRVKTIDLSFLDGDGKIAGYLELADKLVAVCHKHPDAFRMAKTMLGGEEDRLYLIAVQNPAEIRASGGFPGSMGLMRIQDGVLTVDEFTSVANMMSKLKPKAIQITKEEEELFHHLRSIKDPRDADLCPDFVRVGHIWACAYEEKSKEPISGVISVTPHLVQRLLAVTGEEVTLSDGSVMNGNNAMAVLLHDIYFKYFSKNYVAGRETISDELFAEAAKKTMGLLTDGVSLSRLMDYLPVAEESFGDRTLMLWMKDEAEQAFITKLGWHGGLNTDPENPEVGVYFSNVLASKMGWYVVMNTQMGERTKNEDGSYSYPVTVTMINTVMKEEIKNTTVYISGGRGGSIYGVAYFFAPAGGTVSDFKASNGQKIRIKAYHGLELGFMEKFDMKPGTPITVTYTVTTAPGVETPPVFSKTPTAQDYWELTGVG